MGDISTWNPVDNSNTTAPPDGWPEGMAPSAVNNSARAMMGAVRRWYDTVTTQLGTFVPLSGGTMTGTLSAPQLTSTAHITAVGTVNAGYIHSTNDVHADNAVTAPTMTATGTIQGAQLTSTAHITAAGTVTANYIHSTNDVHADNAVTAPTMTATGTIQGAQLTSTAHITAAGTVTANYIHSTNDVHADNAVTAGYVHSTGNVVADLDLGGRDLNLSRNVNASGNINAAGTVTGTSFIGNVSVPANGPVTTGGTVTGGQVTSTGNITAAGSLTAGSIHTTGNLQVDGPSTNISNSLFVGGPVTLNSGLAVTAGTCSNPDGLWQVISERGLKTEIALYERGLEAILALRPCAYRYRPEVFGAEEAEKVRYGLVADEVAPVVPEMVGKASFGGRDISTLSTGHLAFVLVNACRELAAQNAALAARITALEGNHV